MRIWIDLTNSPHVLVMRPVIELLREDGHDVHVTARDFAQTLGLLERFGIEHTAVGRHRGERLAAKAAGLASRSSALVRWTRTTRLHRDTRARVPGAAADGRARAGEAGAGRDASAGRRAAFDVALGHGSNELSIAARLLGIPCSTMFDYEWAAVQHHVNCRLAQAVVVPDAIGPERLRRYGAQDKLRTYEGLKEEYYLADFEPSPEVLAELGLDRGRPIVVVRTPPEVSLYHRFESDLFTAVLERLRLACAPDPTDCEPQRRVQAVVLPRTEAQRVQLRAVPGFVVPERAIDAQSLIAYADLVISAGGTMNREAVALGTPVYTTFEGRLGAVDERLLSEGRLRRLERVEQLSFARRGPSATAARVRRDPRLLVELLLSPLRSAPLRSRKP